MKIAIIGFGHIGSVIGSYIASKGHKVYGLDINKKLIRAFKNNKNPINEPNLQKLITQTIARKNLYIGSDFSKISECDVIIITVGTPLGLNHKPQLKDLILVSDMMKNFVKNNQLIIIKSTVPPGTSRKIIYEKLINHAKVLVTFSPERIAEGNAIKEFSKTPIIVGGINNLATKKAKKFWSHILKLKTIEVKSIETAELAKLADNAWIDLNIALANDLAKYSDALNYDIDILEAISAANSLKKGSGNVNILAPSLGVGGYCLTKDPWFIHTICKDIGLDLQTLAAGRQTNDLMPTYSAEKIVNFFNKKKINLRSVKLAVLGLSFKNNTGDIRFTPVLPFIKKIKALGLKNVVIHDELVSEHDAKKIKIKLNKSIKSTLSKANCVAIMAAHKNIKK